MKWLLKESNQALNYSEVDAKKGPRKLAQNHWNTTKCLFYFEWDYVMIHADDFIGAIGVCLINERNHFFPQDSCSLSMDGTEKMKCLFECSIS